MRHWYFLHGTHVGRMVSCMGGESASKEERWALGGRALGPRSIQTTWNALGR
jgi:hypothetical protein